MPKTAHKSDAPAPFALGAPERPKSLPFAQRRAWNKLTAELLAQRKLAQSDGDLILAWLQAKADQYRGTGAAKARGRTRAAEIQAKFEARAPFSDETVASPQDERPPIAFPSLEGLLADVRAERSTFPARLVPGQTVCRDVAGAYEWPEGDPAAVARLYCQEVTQGKIPACDLLIRACARQLNDLESAHTRGAFFDPVAARNIATWYRDFCGLKLEPWETWIVTTIFSWKKASGMRRFSDAWISMGRKNGKTTICGGIGLFGLLCDQEKYAEVYSAATKKDQARLIYRDAVRAVHGNPELLAAVKEFTATNIAMLKVPETDSSFEPLSSEVKSMDGLRPHFILADEIHEWESRDAWDKLCKGNVSRPQPLTVAVTTAGESENCFAHTKHVLATKILTGVFDDDTTFVAVYQLDPEDDFRDPGNWIKANPNLGVSLQPEALRKILAEAEEDPSGQTAFMRYHCNRWVSFKAGRSIPAAKWDKCRGMEAFPDLSPMELRKKLLEDSWQEPCWAGIDVGLISDMTCYCLLFMRPRIEGIVFENPTIIPYYWMPEAGIQEKERAWGVPLQSWAREGWIQLCEGDMVDVREIRDQIKQLIVNGPGKCRSLGFDPWQFRVAAEEIAESNIVEVKEVPQKMSVLTVPCKELKKAIWNGTFWHLNNPVARVHFGNVLLEEGEKFGDMIPRKLSPNEKIDTVSATCTAWARYLEAPKMSSWDGIIKLF
jgi:phage terminase large subunit-like protein